MLGAVLKANKEKILSLWMSRCLKEIQAAGTTVTLQLRDSIPIYIDHLSEVLSTNRRTSFQTEFAHDQMAMHIGKMHGAERAKNRSYVLTEVIVEYHILREVLFEVLEKDGVMSQAQRDLILDSIDQAVNSAAVEFSEAHADIQQKFINTLTHDLKNPITAAKVNADLILKCPTTVEPNISLAKKIVGNLNRLNTMIHNLLDANMIRAGEPLQLQLVQGNLDSMIRDVLEDMSTIHGNRFLFHSKEPIEGIWDLDALRRVIENLVGNAVKYGAPNTPITITLRRGKTSVEISVHNEGTPISESDILLLFEQFRMSKKPQEGTKTGWGLGLTLVKGMVDAHKGKIRVESATGKGTVFILELPFRMVATSSDNKESAMIA